MRKAQLNMKTQVLVNKEEIKNMKKILFLFAVMFCTGQVCRGLNIYAKETKSTEIIIEEKYEDGSYIESVLIPNDYNVLSKTSTVAGNKKYSYKSSSGKLIWTATLSGSFTYNGSTAKCKTSSVKINIVNNNWKIKEKNSKASGASAVGTVTTGRYIDGVSVQTIKRTLTLTCTENGKLK